MRIILLQNIYCFILLLGSAGILLGNCYARDQLWEQELDYQARNNINNLIKGLDSSFSFRQTYIRKLVDLSESGHRELLMSLLKEALSKKNMQISEGVVETFARIADPEVIPTLQDELLYNPYMDVRRSIIIHLPAFCISDKELRYEILDIFESGEYTVPSRLLTAMREPPVSVLTGEYDSTVEEATRIRVESSIAWQLEPVEAIINFGLENDNQDRALYILKKILGVNLGHNKNSWIEFWRSRGRTYKSPIQDEIFATQILSCKMLANLGAEGTELLVNHILWNMSTPYNTVRQGVLSMLEAIMEFSYEEIKVHMDMLESGVEFQPEKIWRERKIEANKRLINTVFVVAEDYLSDKSFDIRLAIVDCLGATHSQQAIKYITKVLRRDSQRQQMRIHIARALGRIGGDEAVRILRLMAEYRGIAVKYELQIQEYQRVKAALEALGKIVEIGLNNKDSKEKTATARKSLDLLLKSLVDQRIFSGAVAGGSSDSHKVAFYARSVLQRVFNNASMSYDPKYWLRTFNDQIDR